MVLRGDFSPPELNWSLFDKFLKRFSFILTLAQKLRKKVNVCKWLANKRLLFVCCQKQQFAILYPGSKFSNPSGISAYTVSSHFLTNKYAYSLRDSTH
jgi:hypothetical protein